MDSPENSRVHGEMKCVVQWSVNTLVKVWAVDCGRSVQGLKIICLQSLLSLKLTLLCVKLQLGPFGAEESLRCSEL